MKKVHNNNKSVLTFTPQATMYMSAALVSPPGESLKSICRYRSSMSLELTLGQKWDRRMNRHIDSVRLQTDACKVK